MIARIDPLLATLDIVKSAGGTVFPVWSPNGDEAVSYLVDERELDLRDLDALATRDLLRRVYVDRVSRCPACRSHHVNVREICPACRSSHIASVDLLHHFRCGYVAPAYEFPPENSGRRCPKCHGLLRHRGSDHDVPGPHFLCEACASGFQSPEIGMLCLACGTHTSGNDLDKILYQDVYGFSLTARGSRALASGGPVDPNTSARTFDPRDSVFEHTAFSALLDDERKRNSRFHTEFALVSVAYAQPKSEQAPDEAALITALRAELEELDKIGRWDDGHFMILLPSRNERHAQTLARRLNDATAPELRAWNVSARALAKGESDHWSEAPVIRRTVPVAADA